MTGADIKAYADSLVQDTMPDAFFLGAVNSAKDIIEGERAWEFLKKLDTSETHSIGATVSTSHTLPTDIGEPLSVSIGTDTVSRNLISLSDSRNLRDQSGSYYIDWANSTYHFTGTEGTGGTVYFEYKYATDDIAAGTSPVWASRFHRILAYEVAKLWFAQDQGERQFSWAPEMAHEAQRLKEAMVFHDERIKAQALNSAGTPADTSNAAYIV